MENNMFYSLTPVQITQAYVDFLKLETSQDTPDWEKGFLAEGEALELVERQGRGYVVGLFYPATLSELLDYALPGYSLVGVVEILSRELATVRDSLKRRNRQIRDLRRQTRK